MKVKGRTSFIATAVLLTALGQSNFARGCGFLDSLDCAKNTISEGAGNVVTTVTNAGGDIVTTTTKAGGDLVTVTKKAGGDIVTSTKTAVGDMETVTTTIAGDTIKATQKAGGDLITVTQKAAGDTITVTQKVGGDLITVSQKAGSDTITVIKKASGDLVTTVAKTAGDVVTTTQKIGGDLITATQKASGDIVTVTRRASGDVVRTTQSIGGDIVSTTQTAAGDFIKTTEKAGGDIITVTEKSFGDIEITARKAAGDTLTTTIKAINDTKMETGRAVVNLADAGKAIAKFVERDLKGQIESIGNAQRRIREGKMVDAIWEFGTEKLKNTDKNSAAMVQESSILNTVGQVAASAYGGPGGAAAYAAWYTYHQTGDANLALRVGILTGATSAALGAAGKMPSGSAGEIAKKSIVAGAIGGLAVAAGGGDETAVKEGFLLSGGMVLVQDGYKQYTTHDLDGRAAEGDGYCMTTVGANCSPPQDAYLRNPDGSIAMDADGNPKVDVLKTDPRRPHVGKWSDSEGNPHYVGERSGFMQAVSRVPGMNAMSVAHDQFAVTWDLGSFTSAASIVPATVITYVGTGAPYFDHLQKSTVVADQMLQSLNKSELSSDIKDGEQKPKTVLTSAPTVGATNSTKPKIAVHQIAKLRLYDSKNFLCTNSESIRRITISNSLDDDSMCLGKYEKQKRSSVLWKASHHPKFCEQRAERLVHYFESVGYSCLIR